MNKKWEICKINEEDINKICEENNLSQLIGSILASKKIISKDEIREFLNPTRDDFHNPFLFKGMDIAVDRIIKAINNKEKILKNEYKLFNLDDCEELLNELNQKYPLIEISNQLEKIREDKRYVQQYYETIEDIDVTVNLLNHLKGKNKNISEYLDKKMSFRKNPVSDIDVSKYINKTYLYKAEDILIDYPEDEDKEEPGFDILYKFIGVDDENPNYGLVEDMNVNEIILEDL